MACAPGTSFQLASVSKQFTAAAVLLLAADGALSLEEPVGRWIEDCPASWHSITTQHLLTHPAGLPHWDDLPDIPLDGNVDAGAELSIFQQAPLRSEPGRSWYYSSPGYVVLAHIVQRAADIPYSQFLAERIFEPLGLTSTFAGNGAAATASPPVTKTASRCHPPSWTSAGWGRRRLVDG
jgi:CubicO group peptidase (beta-lactamase class C family)